VEDAFGYVLFIVVVLAAIVAIISLRGERYSHIGRGGLFEEDHSGSRVTETADPALEAEVRDLVQARNARRVRRGEPPLDVEAEVQRQLRDLMG
jgi:hypothetical protein